MIKKPSRQKARVKRHYKLRRYIKGTASKPRLCVYRSNKHIYAQLVDDVAHKTLAQASTMDNDIKAGLKTTSNVEAAQKVGASIAKKATGLGVETVVFDRGGYIYHGKVKALADSARDGGLKF